MLEWHRQGSVFLADNIIALSTKYTHEPIVKSLFHCHIGCLNDTRFHVINGKMSAMWVKYIGRRIFSRMCFHMEHVYL